MSKASEARRHVNQKKLDEIRAALTSLLDSLQGQIDADTLDNLQLQSVNALRDVTTETDEFVRYEPLGYRAVTLHIVTRKNDEVEEQTT